MRTLALLSAVALVWAQGWELRPLPQPRKVEIPARLLQSPSLRTQSLGWLQPNQSYMVVPDPTNDTDYAGDTLISNGVGPNTRPSAPTGCIGTFFDTLDAVGAYLHHWE